MRVTQYIAIRKSGQWRYTARMTKTNPALASNEVAIKVSIEIPDAIFDKPALEAQIKIPESAVSKPTISAEVVDNVQEIIKQQTGFDVTLQVVEKDHE